ncbi:hypothetical protein [Cryptosporangium minutisporangium]|uniref:Uncharacterized protein n=1 Tax=Cryptosporangium minutisporangium TaxID=113569 RepID=A0ABP6TCF6_9ACTN
MTPPRQHDPHGIAHTQHHDDAANTESAVVAAEIPIAVWRLDVRDAAQSPTEAAAGFESRVAHRLIDVYTRRGETVADFDDDPDLRRAVTTADRRYLAITQPRDLAPLALVTTPISLVTFRWRPQASALDPIEVFTVCRLIMARDACVIAIMRPGDPDQPGARFTDQEHRLRAAATAAGLVHLQQIVIISAPGGEDQFLYYSTRTEAGQIVDAAAATPDRVALHIDLLVFSPKAGRHG